MEAVPGLGSEAHVLGALGDEGAQVACFEWRHPHRRKQAGGVKAGQGERRNLVGHHLGAGDQLDVGRMYQRDRVDVRHEVIVELEGVSGHFEDDGVLWGERLAHPTVEVGELDAAGVQDDVLVGVHGSGDEIVLVDVEADEAGRVSCRLRHCAMLLSGV